MQKSLVSMLSLSIPAMASIMASNWPERSLSRRVGTLPRIGLTLQKGNSSFAICCLLGLEVPIAGDFMLDIPVSFNDTSMSDTGPLSSTAAIEKSCGSVLGRSFPL